MTRVLGVLFGVFLFIFSVPSHVWAICVTDYSTIDGNLIKNPFMECDDDADGIPDGWSKRMEDANHRLTVVNDPLDSGYGLVLKSEYIDNESPLDFGWLSTEHTALLPNSWYELTITYRLEDVGLNLTNDLIAVSSNWIGVSLNRYSSSDVKIYYPESSIFPPAQHFTAWDDLEKIYRTYGIENDTGWQTKTIYFKTSEFESYGIARTYHYPPGTMYISSISVKKLDVQADPEDNGRNAAGALETFSHKGEPYFPIILSAFPKFQGQDLSIDIVKENGFNTVADSYRSLSLEEYQSLLTEKQLTVAANSTCMPWSNSADCSWANDPSENISYLGYQIGTSHFNDWKDYPGTILYNALPDEIDCNPQTSAQYPGYMQMIESYVSYIRTRSSVPVYANFCGTNGYTYDRDDRDTYYLPIPDIFSLTQNTHVAYSIDTGPVSGSAQLPEAGKHVRNALGTLHSMNLHRKALAYGLGTYWWSTWNGTAQSADQYIPFNLQRFQIWDQIINGATGALFYISGVNLDNEYYSHQFNQASAIAKELGARADILTEDTYYDEWSVNDNAIEIMMKKHQGKIYLFTANASEHDRQNVTISIDPRYTIASITALNDIIDGDFSNPVDRIVTSFQNNSFTDSFIGESVQSPQGHDAPGYGVHVYEITYDELSNTLPQQIVAGNSSTCNNTQPSGKAPWLYNAKRTSNSSVTLYFTRADGPVSSYALVYGTKSNSYVYGAVDIRVIPQERMSYTVTQLAPNTPYYFRVRADNGCATGPWSNELRVRTLR